MRATGSTLFSNELNERCPNLIADWQTSDSDERAGKSGAYSSLSSSLRTLHVSPLLYVYKSTPPELSAPGFFDDRPRSAPTIGTSVRPTAQALHQT
jgi:hypothetical protein